MIDLEKETKKETKKKKQRKTTPKQPPVIDSKSFLLPYQLKWINDESKMKLYLKSRRIGITWAEAFWSVRKRLFERTNHYFVSLNEGSTKEFIGYCRRFGEAFNLAAGEQLVDIQSSTTERIRFANGAEIIALNSSPAQLRGKGGDLTIDEIAFHPYQEKLMSAATPVITWGGASLHLISSQGAPSSLFYQISEAASKGQNEYSFHKTTIVDACDEGLALKIDGDHLKFLPDKQKVNEYFCLSRRKECIDDPSYRQEYMCEPAELRQMVKIEEYNRLVISEVEEELDYSKQYGPLFIGIDLARHHDLTVVWVLEQGVDHNAEEHLQICYRTVAVKAMKAMKFDLQLEIISKYLTHPNVQMCITDETGLGIQITEELVTRFGHVCKGLVIGGSNKPLLVERVKRYIDQERVSLCGDEAIRDDILAMRRLTTAGGSVSYGGRSSRGSHCDYYMALALCLHGAESFADVTFSA